MFAERPPAGHGGICADGIHETSPGVLSRGAGAEHLVGRRIVRLNIVEVREHFFVEKVCDLAIER